jgi:CheY-like chemotaxis protein
MTRDELLATRILVVDDEDANVRLLEELLQREGFQQVIATTDSSRVMGLVNAFEPDLILLDLMMPAPDGYALLEQLSRYTGPERFLPVIVLTADPSRSTRHHALGLGAKDFLNKPLDTFEVALRVWNCAETVQLFRRLQELTTV